MLRRIWPVARRDDPKAAFVKGSLSTWRGVSRRRYHGGTVFAFNLNTALARIFRISELYILILWRRTYCALSRKKAARPEAGV